LKITVHLSEGLGNILNIFAEKANRSLTKPVYDIAVIKECGNIPEEEVYSYLNQLEIKSCI
jgi:hypothetical protein